jgi:molecular chaperone GrpE
VSRRRNGEEKETGRRPGSPAATDDSPPASGSEPAGLEPSASAPADEIAELRREVAELKDALLRRRADFENFKKRVERDRGAATADAEAAVLRQLLGTVDNLERALQAQDSGAESLREGVALTHRELTAMLDAIGVEAIAPLGQPFDPAEHQAILHEPALGFAPGTVAEVYRKGFRYRDRLLRPAFVKVASGASGSEDGGIEVQ